MRVLRSALVFLVAFALRVLLTIPVEDLPQMSYHESEAMPSESTPLFSIDQRIFLKSQPEISVAVPAGGPTQDADLAIGARKTSLSANQAPSPIARFSLRNSTLSDNLAEQPNLRRASNGEAFV